MTLRPALNPEGGRGSRILRRADDCTPRKKRTAQAAHDAHSRHGHLSLHDDPVRGGPGVERARSRRGADRGPQDFSRHAARRLDRRAQGQGHLPGRVDLQYRAEREDARRQHQGAGGRRGARQIARSDRPRRLLCGHGAHRQARLRNDARHRATDAARDDTV